LAQETAKDNAYSISSKSSCKTAFLIIQPPAIFIAATISFMLASFGRTGTSGVFEFSIKLGVIDVMVVDVMLKSNVKSGVVEEDEI
jgi:hypothetical protein